MKKISLSETKEFKNSDNCIVTEYPFFDNDIDFATATINGKYPERGYCVNTAVKEMIYVISGEGKIVTESEVIQFSAGDSILIDKGEKYFWDANCKIAMSCSPAWYPSQHIVVEE